MHPAVIQNFIFDIIKKFQIDVRHHRRLQRIRTGQDIAAVQFFSDTRGIQRRSLPRAATRLIGYADLHIPDFYLPVLREIFDLIALLEWFLRRTCNDCAVSPES